jgi:hypothetical protein
VMHAKRRWGVGPAPSPEDLARKLTQSTWTLCTGFYVDGHPDYLFLNDATHEDGAAEFAIIKGGLDAKEHTQIESITFSWCSFEKALEYVQQALAGAMDHSSFARPVQPRLEPIDQHGRCPLCA